METTFDTKIVALYDLGLSLKQIGNEIGRSNMYAMRCLKRHGIVRRPYAGSGPEHSQWKGGRLDAGQGYFRQWIPAEDSLAVMRNHQGYVLEHRLVMARDLSRPLTNTETVHHIDGDRANNRLDNLELRQGKHGKNIAMVCLDCGSHNVGHGGLGKNGA